jgi:predicted dehydrogenase
LFEFTRLSARASRADKCNVFVNSKGAVLGIRDGVVYAMGAGRTLVELFRIQGDTVLHRALCEDGEGWTHLGEYFQNPHRGPVRIYRVSPDLDDWEVAQEFHAGSIRHVHALHHFIDCVANNGSVGPYGATFEDGYRIQVIMKAIACSRLHFL